MKNERDRRALLWRRPVVVIATVTALALGGAAATAAIALNQHAGPQADGTAFTPIGWKVTPAGDQKPAGFFPANAVLSPNGKVLLVPNIVKNSNNKQTVQVIEARDGDVLQELELDNANTTVPQGVAPGLVFSHDGKHVYLATANKDAILVLDWDAAGQKLSINRSLKLPAGSYPQTVAISTDDATVYATGQLSRKLIAVDVATGQTASKPVGSYPYGVVLSPDGKTAYVSNQGGNTLSVFSVDGLTLTAGPDITVGTHPNALLVDKTANRLFVSNGDSDNVSVVDPTTNTVSATISVAPYKDAPGGTQPTNLALSADAKTLYVTAAGNNDVTVVDLSDKKNLGTVTGLIPTGWYPTGVQPSSDGKKLLITSAKGLGTGPNKGTDPTNPNNHPYIERQLKGYVSLVDVPNKGQLAKYTDQVRSNNGFPQSGNGNGNGQDGQHGNNGNNGDQQSQVVPRRPGDPSPIKHVIYVVKENRTYDQVFGDMGKANGDPSLAIFGKDVTPNHHKLADQFVTLDNFYANGEVSQNGWQWATQASSNAYNETATAQGYAGNGSQYDSEGYHPDIAAAGPDPAHAYLWDKLAQNNISFRNYGQFVVPSGYIGASEPVKCAAGSFCAHDPLLDANTAHNFPWFDMGVSDQHRFHLWNAEFAQYQAKGNLPAMQFIDLPRDHTAGGGTAKQLVADNDLALGKIVDTVSHSQFWKDTAIFVVEDDAQNGPDHVDAHRTVAEVISPYTQTGSVDSHFYSQVSALRTMELFLGVSPMSQYDAAALPMIYSFTNKPNFAPYDAVSAPTVAASMSSTVVKPGQQVTVNGMVSNTGTGALTGVEATLKAPDGWTVASSSGTKPDSIAAGASAKATWTLNVPATAATGQQLLTVQASYSINGRMNASQQATIAAVVPDPRTATIAQAFVANYSSNTVSAVDLTTGKSMAEIPVGAAPGALVVTPDKTKVFVANQNANSITEIDVASDAVLATIPTGKVPDGLAVSPDSKTLWVTDNGEKAVQSIDIATATASAPIAVGNGPGAVAISPDGATVYVGSSTDHTITPISTGTRTVGTPINVGMRTSGLTMTHDGAALLVRDGGTDTVSRLDLASQAMGPAIHAGKSTFDQALSPDGNTLYLADSGSNTVTPVDLATGTAKPALTAGATVTSVAVSPDGSMVYATAAGTNQLIPISVATGQASEPVKVGSFPTAVVYAAPVGGAAATVAAPAAPVTQSSPSLLPAVNRSLVMSQADMSGHPDAAGADSLNEELWKAVRGQDSQMPAPQHNLYGNLQTVDADGYLIEERE
ncbi:beta-propeller fold lactonase family protein [Pseudarthrobacter sp. P1]|uniref:beta-propeller fold lactonase family protein n=1 Tax=Pseudarthrobacter sp. P1 TaxID=3418418 RepID=UPI003CF7DD4E